MIDGFAEPAAPVASGPFLFVLRVFAQAQQAAGEKLALAGDMLTLIQFKRTVLFLRSRWV